jgi:chromosome partitioning protein
VSTATPSARYIHPVSLSKPRVVTHPEPKRILVANSKGGCGKTTLSTNLATYFARQGGQVALIDYDPQASSYMWIKSRHASLPPIFSIKAYEKNTVGSTRAWQMKVPLDTTHMILDSPAGLIGNAMDDLIKQAAVIVVPIVPSPIDIRAAARFIKEILLSHTFRANPKPIGVIANRVRRNTLCYSRLRSFLSSLRIPFVTSIRDTQYYVRVAEHGMGLFDMQHPSARDLAEWVPLTDWIEHHLTKNNKKVLNY